MNDNMDICGVKVHKYKFDKIFSVPCLKNVTCESWIMQNIESECDKYEIVRNGVFCPVQFLLWDMIKTVQFIWRDSFTWRYSLIIKEYKRKLMNFIVCPCKIVKQVV